MATEVAALIPSFPPVVTNTPVEHNSLRVLVRAYNEHSSSLEPLLAEFEVETVHENIHSFMRSKIAEGIEESFYVFNFSALLSQFEQWRRLLPRVEPFYACKCNPHPAIVRTLAALGTGFDCASTAEMAQVLALGVPASKIIFANPCKVVSNIKFAHESGVNRITFDNHDELIKISKHLPDAELVLRILPDDSKSLCKFGSKFGASLSACSELLQTAMNMQLNVVGISFHVGSGCMSASAFGDALHLARQVFDMAEAIGFHLTLLDVGGGFPGTNDHIPSFPEIAAVMTPLLDELFPPEVRVIGEPGRYFAASTMTLATCVHSRRVYTEENEKKFLYYVDEGVYGAFNCIFFDHQHPEPVIMSPEAGEHYACKIFGPTCDSMDLLTDKLQLPELKVGDWLFWDTMGAYTSASSSQFNGFSTTRTFFIKCWS